MIRFLALALLTLSLPAAAAPRYCPGRDVLPFPLPSDEESAAWGDDDYERWEAQQWRLFCRTPSGRTACECRR